MDGGTTESTGGGRRTIVEDLGSLEGWWNTSGIVLWSFVLFGSFLLNATLLLAFLKRPGLRTISNRFVMNLTVSNLLTCAILNPLLMMDGPSSAATRTTCSIAESATALVTSSSILSVLLIAVDQYFAVVDPLRYRTRIDKLKCGILVVSMWLVSVIFGILAGFNPSPESLWLVCGRQGRNESNIPDGNYTRNETLNLTIDASLRLLVNSSRNYAREGEFTFTKFEEDVRLYDNTTELMEETFVEDFDSSPITNFTEFSTNNIAITYGMIYGTAYALFAYLLPFMGVCWIYVSIYSAAHKNSERTRRTGSRPILSSASFSEEYCPVRQDVSSEDFRRIPKISSLSSIDESIETLAPTSQTTITRSGSELFSQRSNNQQQVRNTRIEESESTTVVFTVGSSKVDVTPQQRPSSSLTKDRTTDDITKDYCNVNDNKVPTAVLKAQFFDNNQTTTTMTTTSTTTTASTVTRGTSGDFPKSIFREESQQKRKSSHDLMYEEMMRCDLEKLRLKVRNNDEESSEDGEEEDEDEEDEEEEKEKEEDNENFATARRDVETGEICESTSRINYDSLIVNTDRVENLRTEIRTVDSIRDEPDSIRENDAVSIMTQIDPSSRKNSLDDSIVNNHPSQSSILKTQHQQQQQGFLSCRSNLRGTNGFHRNDHSMIYDDHQIFGKSSLVGNLESHIFGGTSNGTPIVTITPPNRTSSLQRVSSVKSTSSYINSLKHRISNGSLFKYREETRAARISALVIVMGLICWTPYVVVLILKNMTSFIGKRVSHDSEIAAMSFMILATYVSPLLFGYRSRRVKRELRKFFCFRRELSYKNNRSLMAKKVLKRRHSGNMSQLEMDARYNIFNCVYGRTRWPKDKVHFVQVPETALVVETCRSSFSSGASTQISSTSTEEC